MFERKSGRLCTGSTRYRNYHVEGRGNESPGHCANRGFRIRLGPDRKRRPYGWRSHGAEALSPFSAYHAVLPGGRVTPRSGVFPGQSKAWSTRPPLADSGDVGRRAPFSTGCAIRVFGFQPPEFRTRLHVGDSLRSDVQGATGVGAMSVWLNRSREPRHSDINPDFEVHTLTELPRLLDRGSDASGAEGPDQSTISRPGRQGCPLKTRSSLTS
jgi:hypothetical protein